MRTQSCLLDGEKAPLPEDAATLLQLCPGGGGVLFTRKLVSPATAARIASAMKDAAVLTAAARQQKQQEQQQQQEQQEQQQQQEEGSSRSSSSGGTIAARVVVVVVVVAGADVTISSSSGSTVVRDAWCSMTSAREGAWRYRTQLGPIASAKSPSSDSIGGFTSRFSAGFSRAWAGGGPRRARRHARTKRPMLRRCETPSQDNEIPPLLVTFTYLNFGETHTGAKGCTWGAQDFNPNSRIRARSLSLFLSLSLFP
jgi:hypothetical protein